MKVIKMKNKTFAETLSLWAENAYVECCSQPSATHWHAHAVGYMDGRVTLYDPVYGDWVNKDVANGTAYPLLVVSGEDYSSAVCIATTDEEKKKEYHYMYGIAANDRYNIFTGQIQKVTKGYVDWMNERKAAK